MERERDRGEERVGGKRTTFSYLLFNIFTQFFPTNLVKSSGKQSLTLAGGGVEVDLKKKASNFDFPHEFSGKFHLKVEILEDNFG